MHVVERGMWLLLLLVSGCAVTRMGCEVQDISGATTAEAIQLLRNADQEWTRTATICKIGEFVVAVPTGDDGRDSRVILLLRNGRPAFYRDKGSTFVYSPKLEDASFEKVVVNIWHGNDSDDIERLWYDTVGKEPRITVDDTHFTGQPDLKTVWKDHEIVEMYKWNNNEWQRIEPRKTNP